MREGDLEGVVLAAGAALEQEFALVALEEEFWRFARAAGVFGDALDNSDIEVGEDDGEFLGVEPLSPAFLACDARPGGRALHGRGDGLHGGSK